MSTYVMSGPRGDWEAYSKLKESLNLEPLDKLYILGDVLGYGGETDKIFNDISSSKNVFLILGDQEIAFRDAYKYNKLYSMTGNPAFSKISLKYEEYLKRYFPKSIDFINFLKEESTEANKYIKALNHAKVDGFARCGKQSYYMVHSSIIMNSEHINRKKELFDFYRTTKKLDRTKKYLIQYKAYMINLKILDNNSSERCTTIVTGHNIVAKAMPEGSLVPATIHKTDNFIDINCNNKETVNGYIGRVACVRLDDNAVFYS